MAKKILIAYYSFSGNTRKIAKKIHAKLEGTLYEIIPAQDYSKDRSLDQQAKKEVESGYMPALKLNIPDSADFDVLFIGSPNWWHSIAPPVRSFLTGIDLNGKTVIPFITHGGGGLEKCAEAIISLCPQTNVMESFVVYGSGAHDTDINIARLIDKLGI